MASGQAIIFPTDFSDLGETALPWVRRMAEILDAPVHCVYVVEEPHIYATLEMGAVALPSLDDLTGNAEDQLTEIASEHLTGLSHPAVKEVLVGRPWEEIVRYADEHNAGLIVMPTHGYGGVKHAVLGSTTESVLRHAKCPVLSIRNP